MASHGTCQISIQQINNFIAGEPGMVSYPDAADLIHDSIAKFNAFQGLSGGVGASGEMKCKSFPSEYSPHKMLWRIDAKPADAKDVMPTW
ncbi:hypothetical protein GGR56DRAFT_653146 [Xylariaceae sp. FL0804]|nr:hypothetical protein GGR56DRAFT_653146 [Xylariaceae sp. FL0804]